MWAGENGGFRKRRFSVFVWTGENGGFRKRLRHWHWHVPVKKTKRMFFIRFRWLSVDGRKRCKNASVDEKLFIRFQETENGGFRKRISVDRALNLITCENKGNRAHVVNKFILLKYCLFIIYGGLF